MTAYNNKFYFDKLGISTWVERMPSQAQCASKPIVAHENNIVINWEQLKQNVNDCKKCNLSKTRTQIVFGSGSINADLLIVGEAPGFYEDQKGEPFVGKAGELLTLMLQAINIDRKNVFITNVLKCRPENNRDPNQSEVEACTSYLLSQVNLLTPKLVLALGRHAAHFLLNSTSSLASLRGKKHKLLDTDIPLIVTYHPAYLLRNPRDKKHSYQDLLQVRELLN